MDSKKEKPMPRKLKKAIKDFLKVPSHEYWLRISKLQVDKPRNNK